jgi:hypothetical protein
MFDNQEVRAKIREVLCTDIKHDNPQIKSKNINDITFTLMVQQMSNKHPYWSVLALDNGKIQPISGDSQQEVEEKKLKYENIKRSQDSW